MWCLGEFIFFVLVLEVCLDICRVLEPKLEGAIVGEGSTAVVGRSLFAGSVGPCLITGHIEGGTATARCRLCRSAAV